MVLKVKREFKPHTQKVEKLAE